MDAAEGLAIERAKTLFKAEHANVQPHSGAQANMAAYLAVLSPGDTVMGMSLDQGGHLTHGSPVNFSGKLYNFVPYSVDRELELIDYGELERLAKEHRPKLIVAGATAYTRIIDFPRFRQIADEVWGHFDDGHGPYRRTCRRGRAPFLHPTRPDSHIHHSQDTQGPRGGFTLCTSALERDIDRAVFPNAQGGAHGSTPSQPRRLPLARQ